MTGGGNIIENNIQKTEINTNINVSGLSKEAEGFLCKIAAPALMAGSEFLATKFRVATISTICEFANKYAEQLGIEIKPTPPKFLLPFIEKASLEDDEELKKSWAKLLVAASSEYNSLHIIYAEILSQIGSNEALLLKEIYNFQSKKLGYETENIYNYQIETFKNNNIRAEINNKLEINAYTVTNWKEDEWEKAPYEIEVKGLGNFNEEPLFDYLYKIYNNNKTEDKIFLLNDLLDQKEINSLELLKNLKLIHYEYAHKDSIPTGIIDKRTQVRVFLTYFGYNFIETLTM